MRCEICPIHAVRDCTFVVVFTRFEGGYLFSRQRARDTWETQGGHVEPGETPEMAAHRELMEESGAKADTLTPICGYWAQGEGPRRYGIVYLAQVTQRGPLPPLEMAEVRWFAELPEQLTYPDITPKLFARIKEA